MIPLHCLCGKLLLLVIQMNLFNDFVCPLGSSLNTRYIVSRKYNKAPWIHSVPSVSLKLGYYIREDY